MKKLIISLLITIFASQVSIASPGRTDEKGCHVDKKTQKHHCHEKKSENKIKK